MSLENVYIGGPRIAPPDLFRNFCYYTSCKNNGFLSDQLHTYLSRKKYEHRDRIKGLYILLFVNFVKNNCLLFVIQDAV